MNVKLFVSIVILAAVTGGSAVSCAAEEKPGFERYILASHKDVEWNRYPSMARLDDGRLMVIWYSSREYANRSLVKDRDSVAGIFSDDHGRTWSKPVPLIQTPGYDLDPSILVSGERIFVSSTAVPDGPGITTTTTWATRSEDNGKTWSDPYQIPMKPSQYQRQDAARSASEIRYAPDGICVGHPLRTGKDTSRRRRDAPAIRSYALD